MARIPLLIRESGLRLGVELGSLSETLPCFANKRRGFESRWLHPSQRHILTRSENHEGTLGAHFTPAARASR
jgi:hypothetical protein